jgi:hypothetical protein
MVRVRRSVAAFLTKELVMALEIPPVRVRGAIPWPVFESGLWMRAGIAGAAVAVAAPALAFTGEASPLAALVALVAGACVAVFSYRRTRKLLGADEGGAIERPRARTLPARPSAVTGS